MWLVKRGADLTIQDKKGDSARDLALPWVQKDLDGMIFNELCINSSVVAASGKYEEEGNLLFEFEINLYFCSSSTY